MIVISLFFVSKEIVIFVKDLECYEKKVKLTLQINNNGI